MKKVNLTINVPENKFNLFLEFLANNFGAVDVNDEADLEVPEWHKEIVLKRIKNSKPENFFSFEDLDSKIKL